MTPATCCSNVSVDALLQKFRSEDEQLAPSQIISTLLWYIFIGHGIIRILDSAQTDHLSHISTTPSIVTLRMYRDSKISTMRPILVFVSGCEDERLKCTSSPVIPNYSEFTAFLEGKISFHSFEALPPQLLTSACWICKLVKELSCNAGRRRVHGKKTRELYI